LAAGKNGGAVLARGGFCVAILRASSSDAFRATANTSVLMAENQ
jgi:hypothetical protein